MQRASPGALRRSIARGMQRRSRRRPGRSNQSGPADMLTVLTQNMQRLSTFNPHHSTLFQVFVKLPCPCQVRCLGNPERGFMKKLINTHTVFLQNQEELLARSAIDKNSIPDKREALVVYRQSSPPHFGYPKKDCSRSSWSSLPVVGSTRPRLPVQNAHRNRLNEGKK